MKEILPVAEIMRRDQALAEAPESIRLINAAKSGASSALAAPTAPAIPPKP
jgi:hypothetical protein